MSKMLRTSLLACAATAGLLPATASAQVEEIVVTARRVEERLQDVPTAITALSTKELEDRQIQGILDIANSVPNVQIKAQMGTPGQPQYAIRGVSAGTLNPEVDSPIAFYVDGVYIARNNGALFDMADLERVEVLRGPQGTLFGRNAEAGALHFITQGPTGQWGAKVDGSIGNYNMRRIKATVNTQEFAGLSFRATVMHTERDGFVKNSAKGMTLILPEPFHSQAAPDTVGLDDQTAMMLAARYQNDALQVDYKFDYTDQKVQAEPSQVFGFDTGQIGATFFALQTPGSTHTGTDPINPMYSLNGVDRFHVFGHSLTAQYEIDDSLAVKSISAWRRQWNRSAINTNEASPIFMPALLAGAFGIPAGTQICILCSAAKRPQHQLSEELQLIGKQQNLDWIIGGFYFYEKGFQNNITYIFKPFLPAGSNTLTSGPLVPGDFANGSLNNAINKSAAAYAHFTGHFDNLDIAGGVRYTRDRRSASYWTTSVSAIPGLESFPTAAGTPGPGKFSGTFQHTDYEGTATYKFTQDLNVYARVATGYVSGGILHGAAYKPTTNTTYEAGMKSDWFNRRARLNVALFREDQTDLQVLQFRPGQGQFLTNTGDNRTYGVEVEASVNPFEGMTLSAGLGNQTFKKRGTARVAQPKTNLSLSAEYNTPALDSGIYGALRLDGTYISSYSNQAVALTDPAMDAKTFTRSYWEWNVRASVLDIPTGFGTGKLSGWVRNLGNVRRVSYVANFGVYIPGTLNHPRTYGLDIGFQF